MKSANTIEINGKLYDAKTGRALNQTPASNHTATPKTTTKKFVDGFASNPQPRRVARKATAKHISVPRGKAPDSAEKLQKTLRHSAPKAGVKPKQSATLHRRAVKKPIVVPNQASTASQSLAPSVASTALKTAHPTRMHRANQITKSNAISRFGSKPVPKPIEDAKSAKHSTRSLTHHLAASHLVQSEVAPANTSKKEQLIQQAVEKAASNSTPRKSPKKLHRNYTKRYASTIAVVLLLTGYVAYLNIPGLSMKVAANRAGFAAALPGYTPGGYSLKTPITATPGQVAIDYQANTDDRTFTLKQQPTTWDSVALLENFVTKKSKQYLTYQDRGLTIYIYNGSNAAWVSGGKMYSLEGTNAQLDTDQLLKLATSM